MKNKQNLIISSKVEKLQVEPVQITANTNINVSVIICYHCGSNNNHKAGISRHGKQKYFCKNCNRKFVANPKFKPLDDSEYILTANELGLRVNPHVRHGQKLNLSNIKQKWLQDTALPSVIRYTKLKYKYF